MSEGMIGALRGKVPTDGKYYLHPVLVLLHVGSHIAALLNEGFQK
jgi:hypothetical protein